jgi:hypothetical protein
MFLAIVIGHVERVAFILELIFARRAGQNEF